MSTALGTALEDMCQRLRDAGVDAVADLRDVNPPCVLVLPPSLEGRFSGRAWDATWTALLVAPNVGTTGALDVLSLLLERVEAVVPIQSAQTAMLPLDGSSDAAPAYEITWPGRIRA